MEIKFNSDILTASTSKREITGIIVPFGRPGHTNMGEVVFEQGSLQLGNDVKLFEDHDMNKVRGRMISHEITPVGIIGKFKVARTSAGDDILALAQDGLKSGLSIGASIDQYENKDNQVVVTAAKIVEVSVVDTPAFAEAQITDVAAQKADETEVTAISASDEQTNQTESEVTSMANPEEVTPVVEAAPEVAVEASKAVSAPVAYAKPRVNTDVTAGQYAMAQIKAMRGDMDARDLVAALDVATVSENAGVVPPTYMREIIGVVDSSRPFIDSIDRAALPNSGMTMYIPRITAQASVEQTAEGVEVGSTDSTIDNLSVSIVKFAGANVVNLELIERSDPSYVDQLIRMLAASYAQKTDAYAAKAAVNACGSTSGSSIYKSIAQGIADSYGVMRFTPNKLMVAPTGGNDGIDFAGLLGAVDGSNRPLFAAGGVNTNAAGLVTQGSTNGTVAGLDLVVDPNYTGDNNNDKYALVYPSAAATFFESPTLQLRSNIVANGQVEIGLYGFVAFANKYPTAFRGLSVA